MKNRILLFVTILISSQAFSQARFTLSGTVTDLESGEVLIGATLFAKAANAGAVTNNYGFFSLTLPRTDSLMVVISYIGFEPQVKKIVLDQNIKLNIQLNPGELSLDEVVISASPQNENVEQVQMSVTDIPIKRISEVPVILGETDVLKVVQLLPGVQSGNEGTTGFYVRGGNADQNLVQLDEATVYNPNHLLGLFSTFNSRALNSVTLIKGGFPAQHGGRLSSILDLTMKEGNNRQFHADGGIGYVTSTLTLEGPIKKEKGSFIVSGRRTYIDLVIKPFLPKGNHSNYNFYDLNAKMNWKFSDKDRVFLSGFMGRDKAEYKAAQGINYLIGFGNTTGTLRWNHVFGPRLFVNTSLIYNSYDQDVSAIQDNFFSQAITGIDDINGKIEFQYFPNPSHAIRFGSHYINHKFVSGGKSESKVAEGQNIKISNIPQKTFDEFAFYFNDEIKLSDKLSSSLGIRFPGYVANTVSYFRIEPRASVKLTTGKTSSLKAAYTIMNQFMHLVPSSTATIPTDVWVPSTAKTKPQTSQQYALGYFRNFNDNSIETSLEVYYKDMRNQVLFPEGNQLIENFAVDTALVYGKGWSYGAELYVKKTSGRVTGWLAYTLSWTFQQFDDLNFGNKFPFRYDRRHVLSVVGAYHLNERWTFSGAFVYNTGSAYTVPVGRFPAFYGPSLFEGNYFVYEGRNNARMPAYHRLDLSVSRKNKKIVFGREFESEWILGIYNVYSRLNPYFIYLKVDPASDKPVGKQVSLLPIIPSISYNFKF